MKREFIAATAIAVGLATAGCDATVEQKPHATAQAEHYQAKIDRLASQAAASMVRMAVENGERDDRANRASVATRLLHDHPVFITGYASFTAVDGSDYSERASLITLNYRGNKADPDKIDDVVIVRKQPAKNTLRVIEVSRDNISGEWSILKEVRALNSSASPNPSTQPDSFGTTVVGAHSVEKNNNHTVQTALEIINDGKHDEHAVLQLP